ncbi:MAG TPA: hypothetical protein DDX89_00350 [Candidatus Omnitrophica bacterium]|nr:hypothetical protein [Candidatus Omnitrophota bacterium]
MVAIAPFQALRYDLERVRLSDALCPPYDIISASARAQLCARSSYNFVRLELPEEDGDADRYTAARRLLESWRQQRILVQDAQPSIYLTEHTFRWAGQRWSRLGWISLLRFTPPLAEGTLIDQSSGVGLKRIDRSSNRPPLVARGAGFTGSTADQVLRHEATFDAPKADRAKLLETVRAQLSPIFCIVPDADHQVQAFLTRLAQADLPTAMAALGPSDPSARTTPPWRGGLAQDSAPRAQGKVPRPPAPCDSGRAGAMPVGLHGQETIRLWPITDPQAIAGLQQLIARGRALVADGHHRFAVACSHRHLCDGVMTYFACSDDPAVQVHPIHRVVHGAAIDPAAWQAHLQELCDWEPAASVEDGWQRLSRADGVGSFLYYTPPQAAVVRVRGEVLAQFARDTSLPQRLAQLDVTILHHLLLPRLAGSGLPVEAVRYTPDFREAVQMAQEAQLACAWGLRPIPLATVFELASQRLTLPQKSTYFYPKAPAGLVVYPFDPAPSATNAGRHGDVSVR